MSEIRHHLTDALLIGYSAGTLPEAFNLVVATHVSLCDECRARMHSFDAVGGALIEDVGEVTMGEDALTATLARISGSKRETNAPRLSSGVFPVPLQDYIGGDLDRVKWRRIGGGVSDALLKTSGSATVRLLKIPGGIAVPDHGHRGIELTLVLQGAFHDETDNFGIGDVEVADPSMIHQPIAEPGPDCICLAATDAPLRFNSLLPRIAQRFLRI